MTKSLVRHGAIVCVLLAGAVSVANAQARVAGSLEQLARIVTPGANITLVDQYGEEFSGFITALTPRALTVFVDGAPRVFDQSEIVRIHERRGDSLLNGALVGFAIGAGSGLGMTMIAAAANYYVAEEKAARAVLSFAVVGAGIGILVDALRKSQSIVYDKSTARSSLIDYRVQLTPVRASMLMMLRF